MIKRGSIQKKILYPAIAIIVITIIVPSIINLYLDSISDEKVYHKQLELMKTVVIAKGKTLSKHLAEHTENAIASYNFFSISSAIDNLIKETADLEYGILADSSGLAHVHTDTPKLIETTLDSEIDKFALRQSEPATIEYEKNNSFYLEFITPVKLGDSQWGVLRLGFSLDNLKKDLKKTRLQMKEHTDLDTFVWAIIVTLSIFLASMLIVYGTKRFTRPLIQLTEFSRKLAEGDFSVKMPQEVQNTNDEIGLLSKTFANMAVKLKTSYAKLEKHSRSLEKEIAVRKSTEKALIQTNERFQSVLDNTPAVIYLKDVYGRYLLIGNKFESIFHISKEDVIGKTDKDIFPFEMAEAFRHNDNKVFEEEKPIEFEEYATHDDGIHTYISLKFPLYAPSGNISGLCGISTDITDRIQAENKLKDFSHKLVETQEAERKRIAQELHDSLGQNLLVISNETRRIIEKYPENTKDIESWNLVLSTAISSVKEIKEIAYNLRPSELDHFGLKGTIQSLVERISRTAKFEIHTKIDLKETAIFPELEIQIYRIVQEGLNNIMKHSFASSAMVEVNILNKSIHIEISDDGRGFESQNNPTTEGFGLRGIEERAKMFGGSLKVESARGEGTSLKIDIPLK